MQYRALKVGDVVRFLNRAVAYFIRVAIDSATFHATSR